MEFDHGQNMNQNYLALKEMMINLLNFVSSHRILSALKGQPEFEQTLKIPVFAC